jgi:ABC-type lipoprotein release transport system permease subunit
MDLSELIGILGDLAGIAVTVLLAYVVYEIARLISTLEGKIKEEKKT